MTDWKPNLIPPEGDKITLPKGVFPNRAGGSSFWKKWMEPQLKKIEKLKEPEINFIAFDECAEVTPEALEALKKWKPTINKE